MAVAHTSERSAADFEALYVAYEKLVYNVSFQVLRNHCQAEDVTQIVFLKVWAKPASFRGGNFEAWLTRVARNYCLTLLRQRRPLLLGIIPPEAVSVGNSLRPTVEDEVVLRFDTAGVHAAIRRLKPMQRPLVVEAFFDGETHQEIAQKRSLPLGTVKTRIRSGLLRMRHGALAATACI